jgi:YfiR/HmsC-like
LCALAMAVIATPAHAADLYPEDAVKAAYLYRFAGYVEWAESGPADAPFVIDVLGSPGIARELRRLVPNHPINHRVGHVREVTGAQDLGAAQILFVATGHAGILRALSPSPKLPSMLLVSDEADGLSAGSMLNFVTIDRNVRFEVSLTAADRWGLKISSELLGVAVRVQGSGRQSNIACAPPMLGEPIHAPCDPRLAAQRARRQTPKKNSNA